MFFYSSLVHPFLFSLPGHPPPSREAQFLHNCQVCHSFAVNLLRSFIRIAYPHAGRAINLLVAGRYTKQQLLLPGEDDDLLVFGVSVTSNPHEILFADANNKRVNALDTQSGRVRTLFTSDWFICALRWVRSAALLAILDGKGEGMYVENDSVCIRKAIRTEATNVID